MIKLEYNSFLDEKGKNSNKPELNYSLKDSSTFEIELLIGNLIQIIKKNDDDIDNKKIFDEIKNIIDIYDKIDDKIKKEERRNKNGRKSISK